jgi:two-component system sensor histidine kinase YesM
VTGKVQDDSLILEVTDDGSGMTEERLREMQASLVEKVSDGFGLRTVHQRIQILFGGEYGLTMESSPDVGTRIIVRIPMQTIDKEMRA